MVYKSCKEADLKNRVARTLRDYPEVNVASIMWKGYITLLATGSNGLVTYEECEDLDSMLPQAGDEEGHVYSYGVETMEDRLEALEDYREQMEWLARRKEQK